MKPRVDMSLPDQARLINEVRARPMLYDPQNANYNSNMLKSKVWRKLAVMFNMHPVSGSHTLKSKWKMFRDTYARHLRAQQEEGGRAGAGKGYRWAREMQFMQPFMRLRLPEAPVAGAPDAGSGSERAASPAAAAGVRTRPGVATLVAAVAGAGLRELDSTELVFLGYARAVRALSPLRQVSARAAVAQLVAQYETEQLQERAARADAEPSPAPSPTAAAAAAGPRRRRVKREHEAAEEEEQEDYSVYFDD